MTLSTLPPTGKFQRFLVTVYLQGAPIGARQTVIAKTYDEAQGKARHTALNGSESPLDSDHVSYLTIAQSDVSDGPFSILRQADVLLEGERSFSHAYWIVQEMLGDNPAEMLSIINKDQAVIVQSGTAQQTLDVLYN